MKLRFIPMAILFLFLAALALPAFHADAQAVTKISEPKIRSFYGELSSLFKKPYPHFLTAYDERIHPDLTLTTQTQIHVPNQDVIEVPPITITKDDFIANAEQAYQTAKDAKLTTTIKSIKIAPDGKSAAVQTESQIQNISFPTSDGSVLKADNTDLCDDTLVLNEGGLLQIITSICTSHVTILQ